MLPGWLLKDDFLWKELFKLFLSLIGSLFLAWLIQIVITKRDQKNQEIESRRSQINELRGEFVQIFNEYYKIRKRYKTIRDTLLGRKERNPYVKGQSEKINEILDGLLVTCMELEARYSTLLDRLRASFPEFWENKLAFLMLGRSAIDGSHKSYPQLIKEVRHRLEAGQDIRNSNLEAYFHIMRLQIEDEQDIDAMLRQCVTDTFHAVLSAFDSYENEAAFLYKRSQ